MKQNKLLAVVLSAGLVLAGTNHAFAADSTPQATDEGSSTAITQPTPSADTSTTNENESPNPDSTAQSANKDITDFDTKPHNIDENVERLDDKDTSAAGESETSDEDITDFDTEPHNIDENVEKLDEAEKTDDSAEITATNNEDASANHKDIDLAPTNITQAGDPAVADAPAPVKTTSKSSNKEGGSNPKTGLVSMAGAAGLLATAAAGYEMTKKNK